MDLKCDYCESLIKSDQTECTGCGCPISDATPSVEQKVQTQTTKPDQSSANLHPPENPPKNYLSQAILITLFCCLPVGILAIIFAAQVDSKFAEGDYVGAEKASIAAKGWCIVAVIAGIAWLIFIIACQ